MAGEKGGEGQVEDVSHFSRVRGEVVAGESVGRYRANNRS